MDNEIESMIPKRIPQRQPVVLPDGTLPQILGSGSILGLLGSGGMSNVYKIWNPQMESLRAVKIMKPGLDQEAQLRFQTEIKIMAALSHPNIIKIHSVGEWNMLSYIEMEYIDGSTLSELIEKKGALPLPVCLAIGIMMARALVYAHTKEYLLFGKSYKGIIHRDLKPSNIMIGLGGHLILMDFGIARPVETSLLTLDGAIMGTMQYLAPEQIDGENVGVTADLYSLGAVLYETLTGKKAFPQTNLSELMSLKSTNDFIPLGLFRVKIPGSLKSLVDRCMLHKPEKRPQSALAILKDLESTLDRITTDRPEAILLSFIQSSIDEKIELFVRKRIPVTAIIICIVSVMAVLAGARFLFFSVQRVVPVVQEKIVVPVEKKVSLFPSPPVAPAPMQQKRPQVASVQKQPAPSVAAAVVKPEEELSIQKEFIAPVSYLDEMKAKHGLIDPVELMVKESGSGNHESVLKIYDLVAPPEQQSAMVALLRLRSLYALKKSSEMAILFTKPPVEDGEYYLIWAKYLLNRGAVDDASQLLEKSAGAATLLLDAQTLRRDYLFYRALCSGSLFERVRSEENRTGALDRWFEVKNYLRHSPNHEYYQKAVTEMQNIIAYSNGNKGVEQ